MWSEGYLGVNSFASGTEENMDTNMTNFFNVKFVVNMNFMIFLFCFLFSEDRTIICMRNR